MHVKNRLRYFKFPLVTLCFILVLNNLEMYAQNNMGFWHYTVENGLVQNSVHSICQDSRGYIWIGTFDGLLRFDGYEFRVYRNSNKDSLSLGSNFIYTFLVDSKQKLWIGTIGGGLYYYNPVKDNFHHVNIGEGEDVIRSIFEDRNHNIWVGTNNGLIRINQEGGTDKFVNNSDDEYSLSFNQINSIVEDVNGNIWIGTKGGGLNKYVVKENRFYRYFSLKSDSRSIPDKHINSLFCDQSNILWVGTQDNGLFRIDLTTGRTIKLPVEMYLFYKGSLSHNTVTTIVPENQNELWIGTLGGGLSLLDKRNLTFRHYIHNSNDKGSLSKNVILSVLVDESDNLWVGTEGGGLNFFNKNGNKIKLFQNKLSDKNSLNTNSVLSLIADENFNYWIGLDEGGLDYYDVKENKFTHYVHDPGNKASLGHNVVSALEIDHNGDLWVGHPSDGIDIFHDRNRGFRHLRVKENKTNSLSNNNIFYIYEDSDNQMWIGTNGGGANLYLPSSGEFRQFKHNSYDPESISNDYVTCITEDSLGNIWLGTWEGLNMFDKKNSSFSGFLHSITDPQGISNNSITSLYVDSTGGLWIGTFGGLNLYNRENETFKVYTEEDGLPNNVICGILGGKSGTLWLSTYNGICKFDPLNKKVINFNESDGLQGNQFNLRANARGKMGELLFGGINGLNVFWPDSIIVKKEPPKMSFTGFKVLNNYVYPGEKDSPLKKPLWETKRIDLKYTQSSFSIEFASINFTSASKCKYLCILDGYENQWSNCMGVREKDYTKVAPGTYVFRIRAQSTDYSWPILEKSIRVVVHPPFWRTWWFLTLITMVILMLAISGHIFRIRLIKRQKEALEEEVSRRTLQVREQSKKIEKQAKKLMVVNRDVVRKNIHLEYQKEEIENQAGQIKEMNRLLKMKNEDLSHHIDEVIKARVMQKRVSFEEFKEIYPDVESCYAFLRELREKTTFKCKKCGSGKYTPLTGRFLRRCKECGYREPLTYNTIFYRNKFSIVKAFYILYLVSTGRELTVDELSQLIHLRKETCWAFRNRVMNVMRARVRFKNPREGWKELIIIPKKLK